jgi:formamidopyrimidine-DNA glycosylase
VGGRPRPPASGEAALVPVAGLFQGLVAFPVFQVAALAAEVQDLPSEKYQRGQRGHGHGDRSRGGHEPSLYHLRFRCQIQRVPELPDLVRVERVLSAALAGKRITGARTGDPTVLRVMVPEPFPATLVGRRLNDVQRRGHFMRFALEGDLVMVVNAMLVGRYRLRPPAATPRPKDDKKDATKDGKKDKDPLALGLALVFEDGTEMQYLDEKRMGKVYAAPLANETGIPVYGALGIEVLSPALDAARFRALARGRRDQVRSFLMDKRTLASIGNAYADEILFAAGIHPKTMTGKLAPADLDRLHGAMRSVLAAAIDEIERRGEPVDVKVRDFLKVRGRDGKPCPTCGTVIRSVRVGDGDACFCPTCQPATRRLFVDWSRLPGGSAAAAASAPAASTSASASTDAVVTAAADPVPVAPPAAAGKARSRPRSRR